jgi:hypothetical protein
MKTNKQQLIEFIENLSENEILYILTLARKIFGRN